MYRVLKIQIRSRTGFLSVETFVEQVEDGNKFNMFVIFIFVGSDLNSGQRCSKVVLVRTSTYSLDCDQERAPIDRVAGVRTIRTHT